MIMSWKTKEDDGYAELSVEKKYKDAEESKTSRLLIASFVRLAGHIFVRSK